MFRNKLSRRNSRRRFAKKSLAGRYLRYEVMEGRLVLSASGFDGNECAPELMDDVLGTIVPTEAFNPEEEIAFSFTPANVVEDLGVGATAPENISFVLDPDLGVRQNGATPEGAALTFNDTTGQFDFSWTPTTDQIGTFRLFLIATDDGGVDNLVPLSDAFAFDIIVDDTITAVDLNGVDDDGIDATPVDFTENQSNPVNIVDSDVFISVAGSVAGNGTIASATAVIDTPQADGLEELNVLLPAGSPLIVDTSTPGQLVLTVDPSINPSGEADAAVFEEALSLLTYNNTSDDPVATQTVSITVNDGETTSEAATATINITALNDQPDLLEVSGLATAQVGEEVTVDLVATDPDGPDLLVFQIVLGPTGAVITPSPDGSAGQNTIQVARGDDGFYRAQITWTPTAEQGDLGSALFQVTVTDTGGLTDAEAFEILIENQAPVAVADQLSINEDDGSTNIGNITTNDTDVDGDTITVNSVNVSGTDFPVGTEFTHPDSGALITISADGQVDYNPNGQFENLGAGDSATDTFDYTIIDSEGNVSTATATVTITIDGQNDAPTLVDGVTPTFDIDENAGPTPLSLATLLTAVNDVDDNETFTVVAAPADPTEGGAFSLADGTLSFDPTGISLDVGALETINFDVTLQDSGGEQVTVAAVINVNGVDDTPVAVDDSGFTTDQDTELTVDMAAIGLLANDTDDGDLANLTVTEVNGDAANVGATITVSGGNLTVNADGTFTFDPNGAFDSLGTNDPASPVTFTYAISDGTNTSNAATVTIDITGLNDTPVANDDNVALDAAFGTDEDTPLTGANVLTNDTDADTTDTLTVSSVNGESADVGTLLNLVSDGGRNVELTVNADGSVAFTPGSDFNSLAQDATDTVMFDYIASDGIADSLTATATITITGVDDTVEFNLQGLADNLPSGTLTAPDEIAVILNLASPDTSAQSLSVDLSTFIFDPDDGQNLTFDVSFPNVLGSTPFPADNLPTLSSEGSLLWTPDAGDVADNYVLRVLVDGQEFDITIDVINATP